MALTWGGHGGLSAHGGGHGGEGLDGLGHSRQQLSGQLGGSLLQLAAVGEALEGVGVGLLTRHTGKLLRIKSYYSFEACHKSRMRQIRQSSGDKHFFKCAHAQLQLVPYLLVSACERQPTVPSVWWMAHSPYPGQCSTWRTVPGCGRPAGAVSGAMLGVMASAGRSGCGRGGSGSGSGSAWKMGPGWGRPPVQRKLQEALNSF